MTNLTPEDRLLVANEVCPLSELFTKAFEWRIDVGGKIKAYNLERDSFVSRTLINLQSELTFKNPLTYAQKDRLIQWLAKEHKVYVMWCSISEKFVAGQERGDDGVIYFLGIEHPDHTTCALLAAVALIKEK